MRICLLIVFLLFALSQSGLSQSEIKGNVQDAAKKAPLEGVVLTLLSRDTTDILGYATTGPKGEYVIGVSGPQEGCFLKASLIGFKTQFIRLGNQRKIDIAMAPQVTQLKEVFVKPPKITQRRDTISYNVSGYANVQDKTIGDVLKKLPGIDVQTDGTVLYNGKAINKFYIEGQDMLESRYGLAVNNLAPQDVQSVEVLEDHQPIRVLKNSVPSDRAALNLKLKKQSKARWLGHLEADGGVTPALWKADLLALKFAAQNQTLNLFQTNNIGENIKTQFKVHTLENYINGNDNQIEQTKFIKVAAENAPIADERSMLNRTFAFSSNSLYVLKHDYQVKVNLNYINDRLSSFKNAVINYYGVNDLDQQIIENSQGVSKQNQGNLDVNISKNTDKFYLIDKFSGQALWDNTTLTTTGTNANQQQSQVPYHFIDNDFSFIKSYRKTRLAVNSFNHLTSQPEELAFTSLNAVDPVIQQATHHDFYSNTNFAVNTSLHHWVMEYRMGMKATVQRLNSGIDANGNPLAVNDSLSNRASWKSFNYWGSVSGQFATDVLNFKISLPANFYVNTLSNSIHLQTLSENHFYLNPVLSFNYKFTPKLSMNARAELTTRLMGIENMSSGYIYETYRSISAGNSMISMERRQNYALSLTYRSPLSAFFLSLSGTYSPVRKNLLTQRSFDSYITIQRLLPLNNDNSNWSLSGRISKGFDDINATASVMVTYNSASNALLQHSALLSSENRSVQISPKYVMSFNKVVNVEYNGSFSSSNLLVSNVPSTGSLSNLYQQLSLGYVLNKKLNMKAGVNQVYNQLTQTQNLSAFFADFKLQYIPARNLAMELSFKNILNKKTIAYNFIETASNSSSIYTIRPFNALIGARFNF